jgi:hypothetical protein
MQAADREQFEEQLSVLCVGYEQPVTKARRMAYWSGLAKMSLAQFTRCIEFALSEEGPKEIPNTKGIWRIHRSLRAPGAPESVHTSARANDPDHLAYWANRLLYAHVMARGGLGSTGRFVPAYGMVDCKASPELAACLKFKREIVEWFAGPIREGDPDVTPAEFLRQWIAGLQEISHIERPTYQRWCEMIEQPQMQRPFDPSMGRALAPVQTELAGVA